MHAVDAPPRAVDAEPDGPFWQTVLRHDFAASFVVFLVALPLCMGIAQASGVPVAAGIITGIVGGIVVGCLAGSPLQVSGPAAGLTVLVFGFVREHGLPALGIVVLLAGAIQLTAGLLRLGQWFRAVSPAVIRGMLSGIGVLIFASQFHLMVDDRPKEGGVANLITIPEAVVKGFRIPELAPAEARGVRTQYLHRFSELHEHQEEVRELVAERVSDNPSPEQVTLEQGLLKPLAARQGQVLEDLRKEAAEARRSSLAADGSRGARQFTSALDRALSANAAALAALEATDLNTARERQLDASESLAAVSSSLKRHDWAAMLGLLTIVTIVVWQTATPKRWRLVPGPLMAVLLTAGVAFSLSLPVLYVEVPDNLLDGVHFPSLIVLQDVPVSALLTGALVFAAVASAETLLCATAVDQMHSGPRTKYDKELAAQGLGNMVCGFLGGLPMTGVIVRSATNVQAGGRTRASAIMHGLWLLVFVVALGGLLRYVPTSVLAGILVYTGYKLIDFKALRDLRSHGKGEVMVFVATVVGIVAFDLLTGVIIGIALASLKLLLTFSRIKPRLTMDADANEATLELNGAATFVRLPKIAAALEQVPGGSKLHIDVSRLSYLDHACAELLANWTKQHRTTGGDVVIDWDSIPAEVRRTIAPAQQLRDSIKPAEPTAAAALAERRAS
ncbi:MAG: SulP family inorganic anion transporter [Planctomycetota bacterium]|nr:SulP family inorganic anion transporter [Planctomycetaceae bacterium]MDQ3330374.1 SulP family inorganic anion transporter [Planctomycetota bacterium]